MWCSKQKSGFCGTREKGGLYSGDKFPDKRCPNCGARQTDTHLMRCLNEDRMQLLIDTVRELEKWMEMEGETDQELIYWVPKHLLTHDDKPFSQLGYILAKMRALTESQDRIGWWHFTEGYITTHFYDIR